jgi:hypothetical protein
MACGNASMKTRTAWCGLCHTVSSEKFGTCFPPSDIRNGTHTQVDRHTHTHTHTHMRARAHTHTPCGAQILVTNHSATQQPIRHGAGPNISRRHGMRSKMNKGDACCFHMKTLKNLVGGIFWIGLGSDVCSISCSSKLPCLRIL